MLDQLACDFLKSHTEIDAIRLLQISRTKGLYHIGVFLGKFLEKQFPHSLQIKDEYAINSYYNQQYEKSYNIFNRLLNMKGLTKDIALRSVFNQHFNINHISNRYINYPIEKIQQIQNRPENQFPLVTFTITSCKRFDLFEQSVNSFLNSCNDLDKIDIWFCVDDNSSEEDREKMRSLYPFFTFYFKTVKEKGHPQSMNIIRNFVKTPYTFHMEDDWKFFVKRNYISDALDVMGQNQQIKQVLVNKNFAEIESDVDIHGGEFHTTNRGMRYYIHEFVNTDESKQKWVEKHGTSGKNCNYWPHFSFRPSLIQTSIYQEIGEFNETISHFEMDYSYRYFNKGYISAFFEGIYSIHIGRLTSERHDKTKPNAYELNDEAQLSGKEEKVSSAYKEQYKRSVTLNDFNIKMKTYVINLDRRPDRWEDFKSKAGYLSPFNYERFSAVDGTLLKSTAQLQRIFDGNDYNMRVGLVGCAMSHIKIYIELIDSDYDVFCILEDDIDFTPEFDKKLLHVYNQVKIMNWDMVYLGHHLYEQYITDDIYDKKKMPIIEKWDRIYSLSTSMGGTGGYLISKNGAKNLLEYISKTGMINGIDTIQQKSADELNIFYSTPHLIYSECYRGNSNNIDTDIQYNYDSLTVSVEDRLKEEIEYYGDLIHIIDFDTAYQLIKCSTQSFSYYYEDEDPSNIFKLQQDSVHPCYTLENRVIIVVPDGDEGRYFDRLKKNGKYNIDDALVYK